MKHQTLPSWISSKATHLLCALALAVLAGCSTTMRPTPLTKAQSARVADISQALESADRVTLYALDPSKISDNDNIGFHGFGIAGSAVIDKPATRKTIASLLRSHLGNDEENGDLCFTPYQGLRVNAGSANYDLVISIECGHAHIYAGGREVDRLSLLSRHVETYLDSLLAKAHVSTVEHPD